MMLHCELRNLFLIYCYATQKGNFAPSPPLSNRIATERLSGRVNRACDRTSNDSSSFTRPSGNSSLRSRADDDPSSIDVSTDHVRNRRNASQYHEPLIPYGVKITFGLIEITVFSCYLSLSGKHRSIEGPLHEPSSAIVSQ